MRLNKLFAFLALLTLATPCWAVTPISFPDQRALTSVTISSGTTTSPEIDLGGTDLVGIMLPATMTSTTMTFTAATATGGTYQAVQDGAGNTISKTISGGKYIAIDPTTLHGVRYLKLVSGSSEGADRAITVISRPIP
jgi:hypothetical protein